MRNGLPYSRAATRLTSDVPEGIGRLGRQGEGHRGILQKEMDRIQQQGIGYARAATMSVEATDFLFVNQKNDSPQYRKKSQEALTPTTERRN